ncbi:MULTISPECIES: hypothetical protein [unclassified Nostoc]|uniref:hypothetical protein n=1 Tax=unclassified Nostoc TaxID=2593658 RepID=UPI002AD36FF5|nr:MULTISPECIES: hypothetical protein [unclassified Nostoc]MDZ8121796.1 hypothetical protein [Nostoc sp. CmiVER01]MDZ8223578.1 hypothetical protein [Nostoc sp. ChiVER01]
MNSTRQIALLFTVVTSTFGINSIAIAGEGGAAGAVAFTLGSGVVTGVAQSAATGKNDAAAAAFNAPNATSGIANSAYALGSAGAITITNLGNPATAQIVGTPDTALGTAQINQFSSNTTIKIGTTSGDELIKF